MADATPHHSAADRNLRFGMLALHTDFVSRDALVQGMNAWVLEKAEPVGQILIEQWALGCGAGVAVEGVRGVAANLVIPLSHLR